MVPLTTENVRIHTLKLPLIVKKAKNIDAMSDDSAPPQNPYVTADFVEGAQGSGQRQQRSRGFSRTGSFGATSQPQAPSVPGHSRYLQNHQRPVKSPDAHSSIRAVGGEQVRMEDSPPEARDLSGFQAGGRGLERTSKGRGFQGPGDFDRTASSQMGIAQWITPV